MSTISTVKQEFEQAIKENRQPNCPYCRNPLEVEQAQTEYIRWKWSREQQRFLKTTVGNADDPQCMYCGAEDSDFLAFTSEISGLCAKLGLDY